MWLPKNLIVMGMCAYMCPHTHTLTAFNLPYIFINVGIIPHTLYMYYISGIKLHLFKGPP